MLSSERQMHAIVVRQFGPPEVMQIETVPDPSPGPGQVLVRVAAAGVNPVDTYIRSGAYARLPPVPYTPGSDLGGTVERVGANVTAFAPGDRVYAHGVAAGSGAYAEMAVCEDHQLHPLPARVSFAQGAALGVPYGTAWRALFNRGNARAGETVFVHGASGGVGTAAVQLARAHGLRVIGSAGSAEGLAHVRDQGAHEAVNHREAGYLDRVKEITGGRGVDLVIEMLANVNLDRDLDLLALRGRVVVVGNRGRIEIDPRKTMSRDAAILGLTLVNATREELAGVHAGIVAGLENGSLKPVVSRELPLERAPEAHVAVLESPHRGKIALVP
jgi:NADPH2:quinone reductase